MIIRCYNILIDLDLTHHLEDLRLSNRGPPVEAPAIMNEASQMRSGFVSAPPLEMRDDVISMS